MKIEEAKEKWDNDYIINISREYLIKNFDRNDELLKILIPSFQIDSLNYDYNKDTIQFFAIENLNKAISLNPKLVEAYVERGNLNNDTNDLNKAIELDPFNPEVYYKRAIMELSSYDLEQNYGTYSKDDYQSLQRRIYYLNKSIEFNYAEPNAYQDKLDVLGIIGDRSKLLEEYDKFIEKFPTLGKTFYLRGLLKAYLGDFQGAKLDFIHSIDLGYVKDDTRIVNNWRRTPIDELYYLKEYDYLINRLTNTIQNKEVRKVERDILLRARFYYESDKIDLAFADLDTLISYYKSQFGDIKIDLSKYSSFKQIRDSNGVHYKKLDTRNDSSLYKTLYESAQHDSIRNYKDIANVYFTKALVMFIKGNKNEAKELFNLAKANVNGKTYKLESKINLNQFELSNILINFDPYEAYWYYLRGKSKIEAKKYEDREILYDFTKAIQLSPGTSHFYYESAMLKFDLQDFIGSKEDFNKASYYAKDLKYKKDLRIEVHKFKGMVNEKIDELDSALYEYNLALDILENDSSEKYSIYNNDEIYMLRGRLKYRRADYKSALEDFEKSRYKYRYYYIGLTKEKLGDSLSAKNNFIKSGKSNSDLFNKFRDMKPNQYIDKDFRYKEDEKW
ncbi:MAG: hypothetical protein NTW25_07985 [Candidatus Kapabacteria bacterium]|nr:hypothetical protein [Candidatus Kapabacteria bacterium]